MNRTLLCCGTFNILLPKITKQTKKVITTAQKVREQQQQQKMYNNNRTGKERKTKFLEKLNQILLDNPSSHPTFVF